MGSGQRRVVATSVLMIFVGAFFFAASFYAVFGRGLDVFLSSYRTLGRFSFAFMVFYGFAGALTSAFHLSYLVRGWPQQFLAGIYAIGIALVLAGFAVAIMEIIT